jgi:hypothetical protein
MIASGSSSSFGQHAVPASGGGAVLVALLGDLRATEIQIFNPAASLGPSRSLWRIAPNKYLSIAAPDGQPVQFDGNANAVLKDVTAAYAHFLVLGASASCLLAKLTSLSLPGPPWPDGLCIVGPVAGLRCIVRFDDGYRVPAFRLLCSREYGVSLSEVLLCAGREFSAAAIDASALAALRVSGRQTGASL